MINGLTMVIAKCYFKIPNARCDIVILVTVLHFGWKCLAILLVLPLKFSWSNLTSFGMPIIMCLLALNVYSFLGSAIKSICHVRLVVQ